MFRFIAAGFLVLLLLTCTKDNSARKNTEDANPAAAESDFSVHLSNVLANAQLPQSVCEKIKDTIAEDPAFLLELFSILQTDPYLWVLVDKEHPLNENYEPDDLVELKNGSYRVNRTGLFVRRAAAASLEEMSAAARKEGLTLLASSAYRTYGYQVEVYARNVREMGQEAADRESARPGNSQHQLGLVIDFGSITDAFAQTAEGRWLAANASRFGWSLSYPEGYEDVTGYRWECWHYRYVGAELAQFIDSYFDGIQQYALRFIHEYKSLPD
ncbi:MAG: M15 family metallopeptidase [Treponema sp.]|nr:M15 family metallopeptidase [Treponema sp.]